MTDVLALVQGVFENVGVPGLLALWGVKVAAGWIALRRFRLRRG